MHQIQTGDHVSVRDSKGRSHRRRALTGVVPGYDFDVVWACREEEWREAAESERAPEGVPWPAWDVTPE
jgi:hypothetical protein